MAGRDIKTSTVQDLYGVHFVISFTFYLTGYQLNNLSIWAKKISPQQLQPGDLVFFRIKHALHVGFYDTDHHFIHASVSQGVTPSSMDTPYWQKYFITARSLPRDPGRPDSAVHTRVSVGHKSPVHGRPRVDNVARPGQADPRIT